MRTAAVLVLALGLLGGIRSAAAAPTLWPIVEAGGNPSPIALDPTSPGHLVLTAPGYKLDLSSKTGEIFALVERGSGAHLLAGQGGCMWAATGNAPPAGGCADRFSYRWNGPASTLTLTYASNPTDARRVDAVVTLRAGTSSFDLKLALTNHWGVALETVDFPADLESRIDGAQAGYLPTFLPGVRVGRAFFSRIGADDVQQYPSRFAFADYEALDADGGHLALSAVNPAPNPLAPVDLGFVHNAPPIPCSGPMFCVTHTFDTWIPDGRSWSSPTIRVRVGQTADQSILGYRTDNGIDAYPSVQSKLGDRLATYARAPLIKADLWRGLLPFKQWGPDLRRLPSPSLLHPVAYQPGGHDESDPDFLPPSTTWGSTEDFAAMVGLAHQLGLLVMPYLDISWWNVKSRTVQSLPSPTDVAVQNRLGQPRLENYPGDHDGYVVSPYAPIVRRQMALMMDEWRTDVPADCVFFDQIGARPWLRDFNPASPTPISYDDGWLAALAPYSSRCVMIEDGWDRLAQTSVGFHGSGLMMVREHDSLDDYFGPGNWQPYPLADWLLHDKVLVYQHDLSPTTMTDDPEVLLWNAAFGYVLSYSWDGLENTLYSPWLDLVGTFQRTLGPLYAGRPLTGYRTLAPNVTESDFGDYSVVANWSATSTYAAGGYGLAPHGFLARAGDGSVLAGAFADSFGGVPLSDGTHYLLVQRGQDEVLVRQPIGDDTDLAVAPPTRWQPGQPLVATAYDVNGNALGTAPGTIRDGRFAFHWARAVGPGQTVVYRVAAGG